MVIGQWLQPDWPLPKKIKAFVSTRAGQFNAPPYDGFNTADHVGDDPLVVKLNRERLKTCFSLVSEPQWLRQVHGAKVVHARGDGIVRTGDAVWSDQPGQLCVIHTADCLPVFFADKAGGRVALAHAGWRGLLAGVLENTLDVFEDKNRVLVWLGPAIGPGHFEVGGEVYQEFVQGMPSASSAFTPSPGDSHKWLADLYMLARQRLNRVGVFNIYGGGCCTYMDPRFFSYRKQATTGRMTSLIWISPD